MLSIKNDGSAKAELFAKPSNNSRSAKSRSDFQQSHFALSTITIHYIYLTVPVASTFCKTIKEEFLPGEKDTTMNDIADLMKKLAAKDGVNRTCIDGVKVYRSSKGTTRSPLLYEQGVIIVGQGSKKVYLGEKIYEYDPDHYLVLSVPIPAECETTATDEVPFLALLVDIDPGTINSIISVIDDDQKNFPSASYLNSSSGSECCQGLFVSRADDEFKATVSRLLKVLQSPVETAVLGKAMIHELIFRLLCGENSSSLYSLAMKNSSLARIDKALKQIHNSYHQPVSVENLAKTVNMSVSAFHRAFKDVTASSPIQYIKKIRVNKARDLIYEKGMRVNEAANMVGYESTSQFSREFKRYFGRSPARMV
jgi:AraC-like DNA-binding protein